MTGDREARWAGLMRAANRGDAGAYARLLRELAGALRGLVARRAGDLGLGVHETEDIAQEALIAIHAKRATWDEERPFLPWARAIARYKMLDAARRRGLASAPAEDFADLVAAPEGPEPGAEADARRLLDAVPRGQRSAVEAVALDGLTAAEAGERLGMTPGAVRVALHRGLKRLPRLASGGG